MVVQSENLVYKRGTTESAALADGTYQAGMVLVENTSSGLWENVAVDGTARVGILLRDVDTTTDGNTAVVALHGVFNRDKLVIGGGQSWDDIKVEMQKFGIDALPATLAP